MFEDPFIPLAINQAIVLTIAIVPLSLIQYKLAGKGLPDTQQRQAGLRVLGFRYLGGFVLGWYDHILMILGGFHPTFLLWAYWYVNSVYIAILLVIPANLKKERRKWFIVIWLVGLIGFSTYSEINVRLVLYGELMYPPGWYPITTFFFYLGGWTLGTAIGTLHWWKRFEIPREGL